MRKYNLYAIISYICLLLITIDAKAIPNNRFLLDDSWKFTDKADSLFYTPLYDDSHWESISLPHDWSVLHDFKQDEPSGNDGGYLPTGKGYYRKRLSIPSEMIGKPCDLYFEGAYMNSEVFVNGYYVGGHPYGYTSFRCDISPYLKEGENIIAVSIDNSQQKNSRWYSGSGIYRHVWLEPHHEVYIEPWSMQITTPVVNDEKGIVRIKYTVVNGNAENIKGGVSVPVYIKIHNKYGENKTINDTIKFQPGEEIKYCINELLIENPKLWSTDSPNLYEAEIVINPERDNTEKEKESFGFRTIDYTADEGFKLNGEKMLINGACLHHDNGILGAASYDDAEIRKVRLLKDAGFNAVRTSHNPPAPAFLTACDSIGLLVIDEAFDGWKAAKNRYDYSILFEDWWSDDIKSMVKRDRNHPSIICWSIGNEIIERKAPEAVKIASELADACRKNDPTRPVTSALAAWDSDWEIYDPLAGEHDIAGYNYMIHKASSDHDRVPSRVMWQTESYPRDAFQNWMIVKNNPYIIGDFVWTGIDYIGESGIGRHYYEGDPEGEHYHRPLWPWHNACCGDIDIIGERKPISYYREMLYTGKPTIYMAVREPDNYTGKIKETLWGNYPSSESWSWPGHEGKAIEVEVISTYPEIELYQDGKLIESQIVNETTQYKAIFRLPYKAGIIKAIALNNLKNRMDSVSLTTPGKPYSVRLKADKRNIKPSSQSLIYITAEIVDKSGILVNTAEIPLHFEVTGNADVVATGSANPKDSSGYYHNERLTSGGKALAVLKYNEKKKGGNPIIVKVRAKGLKSADLSIEVDTEENTAHN